MGVASRRSGFSVNLWLMKDVLDSRHNAAVVEVFTTWMQGHVSEDVLRRVLTDSGELDRWNVVKLGAKDRERPGGALASYLTNGWCFAARDFRVQRGASDAQTRRGL